MKIPFRLVIIFLCSAVAAHAADQLIALKAARMFDGKSNALVENGVVIVQGDKIVDAGSNVPVPDGAQVIDLGDSTLSPIRPTTDSPPGSSDCYRAPPPSRHGVAQWGRCSGSWWR